MTDTKILFKEFNPFIDRCPICNDLLIKQSTGDSLINSWTYCESSGLLKKSHYYEHLSNSKYDHCEFKGYICVRYTTHSIINRITRFSDSSDVLGDGAYIIGTKGTYTSGVLHSSNISIPYSDDLENLLIYMRNRDIF